MTTWLACLNEYCLRPSRLVLGSELIDRLMSFDFLWAHIAQATLKVLAHDRAYQNRHSHLIASHVVDGARPFVT